MPLLACPAVRADTLAPPVSPLRCSAVGQVVYVVECAPGVPILPGNLEGHAPSWPLIQVVRQMEGHAPSWPCTWGNGRDRSASLHNAIWLRPLIQVVRQMEGHAPSWPCTWGNGRDRSASLHNAIWLRPQAASGGWPATAGIGATGTCAVARWLPARRPKARLPATCGVSCRRSWR
jgi:hypothetical protein